MFRLRLAAMRGRLEGVPSGSGGLASAPVAPVNARTLWVARSLPGQCRSFFPRPDTCKNRGTEIDARDYATTGLSVERLERPTLPAEIAVQKTSGIGLPGCPTFPLPHPGGFVLHDQRVVAGLILIGAGDGHRLFAEFGGFEHTRLAQGHLAELVVGHPEVEERRAEHS